MLRSLLRDMEVMTSWGRGIPVRTTTFSGYDLCFFHGRALTDTTRSLPSPLFHPHCLIRLQSDACGTSSSNFQYSARQSASLHNCRSAVSSHFAFRASSNSPVQAPKNSKQTERIANGKVEGQGRDNGVDIPGVCPVSFLHWHLNTMRC